MRALQRLVDATGSALALIAGIAATLMMLHVFADVLARALFNAPLTGTIVFVSNWYMVALVCLPLAFVERNDGHISVDVLTGLLAPKAQGLLATAIRPLSAAVFAIVAYASFLEAETQRALGRFILEQQSRFDVWPGYYFMPLGYGLASLHLALRFIRDLTGGRPQADDAHIPNSFRGETYDFTAPTEARTR